MTRISTTINPHAGHATSLPSLFKSVWHNRQLIVQMIKREVIGRYKGSMMGLAWSFFNPVLMLVVYTFVFSEIFKFKWGVAGAESSKTLFAVVLFVGLIVLNLFNEVLNRAPLTITSNVNYVKKVIFPLEILPIVTLGTALFHSLISLMVLIVAFILFNGFVHWTVIFVPVVILPLLILTLGFAWILAAIGAYLRDIGQVMVAFTAILTFLSPVFYPITAVPERFQPFIMANPLTFIIEQAREVLIFGHLPHWIGLGIYTVISIPIAWVGFILFQKARKGFADVL